MMVRSISAGAFFSAGVFALQPLQVARSLNLSSVSAKTPVKHRCYILLQVLHVRSLSHEYRGIITSTARR